MRYKENDFDLNAAQGVGLMSLTTLLMLLLMPQVSVAYELEISGTISTQVESVSPNTKTDEDYTGLRDVYTRVAFKLGHGLGNGLDAFALVELPFDTVNMEHMNSFDQDKDVFDST